MTDIEIRDMTPAEHNEMITREKCRETKANFLQIGFLLNQSHQQAYWSQTGWESFRDYAESLGVGSYSQVTRLMNIASCVASKVLSEQDVLEMGLENAKLLLPSVRTGEDLTALVEVAKSSSTRELKAALGHKQNDNDLDVFILCTHCGWKNPGAKWIHKEKQNESAI